ncbi:hypothetical protein Poly41_20370 [Novipirellula artificiosorum]|uniref:Transcription factor zinc-finger domain-containing protein n=2 Tax=Novipirellula artificiosorum TaxID=2528016 RepID=A0A5C6DSH2_9BACT|nr:hypothetical protein Poly41_20370 [Novipirellula artificiosorum]
MESMFAADVEIDRCIHCQSVWLDPGELNAVASASPNQLGHVSVLELAGCKLQCPRCNHNDFCALEFASLSVARCNGCGGVHVDKGTLEKLADTRHGSQTEKKRKARPRKRNGANRSNKNQKSVIQESGECAGAFVADTVVGGVIELLITAVLHL